MDTKTKKPKLAVMTAGGHITSFHAAMHAIAKNAEKNNIELVGAFGGMKGLMEGKFKPLKSEHIEREKAGSLILADRNKPDLEKVKKAVSENDIDALIIMGGDDHLGDGDKFQKAGINVIGYNKTMDNDLSGTDFTNGFPSAAEYGAMFVRNHHATAMTNKRIFYVPLFGRKTDWIVAASAVWGAADLLIPCELEREGGKIKKIPADFLFEKIEKAVKNNKEKYGIEFAVIAVAEGTQIEGLREPLDASYDDYGNPKLQPEWVGMELVNLTKKIGKACFQAHTYDLRDMPPTKTNLKFSELAGEECVKMFLEGDFGKATVFLQEGNSYKVGRAPLEKVRIPRHLRPCGFIEYENLKATASFVDYYRPLFGEPVKKDEIVYKNMLKY